MGLTVVKKYGDNEDKFESNYKGKVRNMKGMFKVSDSMVRKGTFNLSEGK